MITKENIHLWNPMNPFKPHTIMAQLPCGTLQSYPFGKDQAVTELYLLGFKESARELNKTKDERLSVTVKGYK